jgi:hypothetical protein
VPVPRVDRLLIGGPRALGLTPVQKVTQVHEGLDLADIGPPSVIGLEHLHRGRAHLGIGFQGRVHVIPQPGQGLPAVRAGD